MPARLRADRTSSGLDRAGTNGMQLCAHSITPPQPIVMVADVPHHLRLVPQELRESVIRPVSLCGLVLPGSVLFVMMSATMSSPGHQ